MGDYHFRHAREIVFRGKSSSANLDIKIFEEALVIFNETMAKLQEVADNLFGILGMRNLSAFVGEVFASSLSKASRGFLIKNPHQDGYPDLLVMTREGESLLRTLERNMQDKRPFSDFASGGIEVKATCGDTPTPKVLAKKGLVKPGIGERRIDLLRGYTWKAHHRLTNNLVGIVWDFIEGKPVITGIFFASDLGQGDWGKIVHPKESGGRTTSVSIMQRNGTTKMYNGWIAVINDERYIKFFNKFNKSDLIDLVA